MPLPKELRPAAGQERVGDGVSQDSEALVLAQGLTSTWLSLLRSQISEAAGAGSERQVCAGHERRNITVSSFSFSGMEDQLNEARAR